VKWSRPLLAAALLCGCQHQAGLLPSGSWWIEGQGVLGQLQVLNDRTVLGLWSESWGTASASTPVEIFQDSLGTLWLNTSVETAAGGAEAAIELHLEQRSARLPLGFRAGELEFTLVLHEGPLPPDRLRGAVDAHQQRIPTLRQAWQDGRFQLKDAEGGLLGALELLPGHEARVDLFDASMLTDNRVPARRHTEGPDVIIIFPVEPSFADEGGLLRMNVPTLRAVLPVDARPHPEDRWLRVEPGPVSDGLREERRSEARRVALQREQAMLARLGPQLSAAALERREETGSCPTLRDLSAEWDLLLADYTVIITESGGDCVVGLEPTTVQPTRRTAVQATALGLVSTEVLGQDQD